MAIKSIWHGDSFFKEFKEKTSEGFYSCGLRITPEFKFKINKKDYEYAYFQYCIDYKNISIKEAYKDLQTQLSFNFLAERGLL